MSNRLLRVNELLQREISSYLRKRYTSEAVAITISGVQITGDLREAKIYYSVVGKDADEEKAGKFLRSKLQEIREMIAKTVILRHVPSFTVHYDKSGLRAVRIETMLDELGKKGEKPE